MIKYTPKKPSNILTFAAVAKLEKVERLLDDVFEVVFVEIFTGNGIVASWPGKLTAVVLVGNVSAVVGKIAGVVSPIVFTNRIYYTQLFFLR
jgi:hypothetical protein